MKHLFLPICLLVGSIFSVQAQERANPLVKDFGAIYDIPYASVKPDPDMVYNIVIDLPSTTDEKQYADYYLERVARLMNLHVIGGVDPKNLHVVVVVHAGAVFNLLNHKEFNRKYNMDNPNILLLERLHDAGAEILVCGQSLIARGINPNDIFPEVKIATSMLTAVTTYQLKGYAVLQF